MLIWPYSALSPLDWELREQCLLVGCCGNGHICMNVTIYLANFSIALLFPFSHFQKLSACSSLLLVQLINLCELFENIMSITMKVTVCCFNIRMASIVAHLLWCQMLSKIGELAVAKIVRRNILFNTREHFAQHVAKYRILVRKKILLIIFSTLVLFYHG